ncbi:MAG: 4-hydroxy-tetrahydrodipicolinate synthase [Odoribacteraceae bacterium]|jgi:4-hydroxy-tetrahydrodipicolinate synthase|nr:4-hydroxy-tetrahydrodipicolinate synthase [Odoribacteraceae bacterium]
MRKFSGVGVALVTPFNEAGQVDEESLRQVVDYVIDGGVDYLVTLGTTSEAVTLTRQERERVVEVIVEHNAGRLPVVIGVGGNNTASVLEDLAGLSYLRHGDAILTVAPYYNKPNQQGLYLHFKAIAERSPLPLILYNVPGRCSVNIDAETTLRLAREFENIIAVKEAAGNFEQVTAIAAGKPDHFLLLSGDDALALPFISLGADGVISVIANVLPYEYSTMIHRALEDEFAEARGIHFRLRFLYKALFEEGNPAGVKAALHAQGMIGANYLRLPLCPVSDALYGMIQAEMRQL